VRWSKLRSLVIARFARPLQGRLDIHSTAYGACTCGHAWLTLDGDVIANFCTRAHYIAEGWEAGSSQRNPMYRRQLAAFGEKSRQQVYETLWDYVHVVSIEDALASDDMLLQALAVADARVGKRRLAQIDPARLHPLGGYLLMLRGERIVMSPAQYLALWADGDQSRVIAPPSPGTSIGSPKGMIVAGP
jgi:hypothetical protein